jgi:hypothetical protein
MIGFAEFTAVAINQAAAALTFCPLLLHNKALATLLKADLMAFSCIARSHLHFLMLMPVCT